MNEIEVIRVEPLELPAYSTSCNCHEYRMKQQDEMNREPKKRYKVRFRQSKK